MSGLETLIPLIYHEKQQPGSQLCAQHALNAILQGDYFSAPDLAQFAQQLDTLEGSFNNDAGPVSNNMDDTGFFSVQVLEGALRVLGFTLVRWRSQDLRDQQEYPHSQMAFILNHQQHWFTLRRFGSLESAESGHWFNLNSFLREPEWVGKLYLGMVLSQAEDEGYSVFAVLPASEGTNAPRTLPHTEADDIASTLPEPTSSHMGTRLSTAHALVPASAETSSSTKPSAPPSGFEDEDLELQAALQASLIGAGQQDYVAITQSTSASRTTSNLPTPPTRTAEFHEVQAHPVDDPVAASMARNKAIMQRMQREQEMALNEGYDEEDGMGFGSTNGTGVRSAGESSQRHGAQTAGEMEEADAIQRAIEESRAETRANDEQGAMDMSEGDEEWRPMPSLPAASGDRVYDDEDSELQAALKASLEGLPEGFVVPPTPPQASVSTEAPASSVPSEPLASQTDEEEEQKLTVEIDAAEMRRRRLARFAG
ncbi:Josephin-domain-containing protein [Gautieria morchelliformis]|nr:Josephin-domain-containing protein [Gautieria morchelliformis]